MKKRFIKETALLALPAVALLALPTLAFIRASIAQWSTDSKPITWIESMTISAVPPALATQRGKNLYSPLQPDTELTIVLNQNPRFFYQRIFYQETIDSMEWQELDAGYLTDNKGMPLTPAAEMGAKTLNQNMSYLGDGRYSVALMFSLRKVPKSVGEVRLKSTLKVEGRALPIDMTVRE